MMLQIYSYFLIMTNIIYLDLFIIILLNFFKLNQAVVSHSSFFLLFLIIAHFSKSLNNTAVCNSSKYKI
jgi:hypothetical protein